jgi:hypothetical protein
MVSKGTYKAGKIKARKTRVVVQLEKRFVSGHRFSDADKGVGTTGFSRWGCPTDLAAEAGFKRRRWAGMPEGIP